MQDENKNPSIALSLHASYHFFVVIISLSLFRYHNNNNKRGADTAGVYKQQQAWGSYRISADHAGFYGGEIRTSSRLFWLIQVLVFLTRSRFFGALDLFLTSSRYFWWVHFVFFDKLQIYLVGSICFFDKLRIFLVDPICVFWDKLHLFLVGYIPVSNYAVTSLQLSYQKMKG